MSQLIKTRYSKLVVVLTDIGDNIAYQHGLHFCQQMCQHISGISHLWLYAN